MSLHVDVNKFHLRNSTAIRVPDAPKVDAARVRTDDDELYMRDNFNFEGLLDMYRLIQQASEVLAKWFFTDKTGGVVNADIVRRGMLGSDTDGNDSYATGKPKAAANNLGYRVRDAGQYVERTIDMSGFTPYIYNWQIEEHGEDILGVYRKFFPDCKLDTDWERDRPEDIKAKGSLQGSETYSLNEIISLTQNMSPDIRTMSGGAEKIKARRQLLKVWGGIIFFDLTLSSQVSLINNPERLTNTLTGTLNGRQDTLNVRIKERVRIQFPKDAAEWMTSVEDSDDFSLFTFLNHISPIENRLLLGDPKYIIPDISTRRYNAHKDRPIDKNLDAKGQRTIRANNAVYQSSSPSATLRSLQNFAKKVGSVPPRMNADGYTMGEDAQVIFANYAPDVEAFREAETKAYDKDAGQFVFTKETLDDFRNKVLIVDWGGNVIAYTTDGGNIQMIDLKGAQALTDADIGDHLLRERVPSFIATSQFEKDVKNFCEQLRIHYEAFRPVVVGSSKFRFTYLDYHTPQELDEASADTAAEASEHDLDEGELRIAQANMLNRGQMFTELWRGFDDLEMPISKRMYYRYMIQLMGDYATQEKHRQFTKAWSDQVHGYTDSVQPTKDIVAYNLEALKAFYPHQRRIVGDYYTRMPDKALIGVSAGGGKTTIAIGIANRNLQAKTANRVLLIMPGQLKANFSREINRFSDHGTRVFPIYRAMWDRWSRDLELGFAELQAIIESQPVNTLFVTDYGFLKLRPMTVRVGHKSVTTYPFAVFMSRLFSGMWIADESHKIKNLASQLSEAFRTYAAYGKRRVEMSGTTVFNTSDDIIGQMSGFSPNAFGSDIQDYQSSKGIISLDKLPDFHRRMNSFVKRYDANKREWAFLLPKVISSLHSVTMPRQMQEYYNDCLAEALSSLEEKAKALAQKEGLALDDPSLEARLSAIARTELTPLEIFINAPDDPDNRYAVYYMNHIAKGKPELLVSPKVAEIDRLIDNHMKNGDGSKVLVLSFNLAISKHLAKHSKFSRSALHYTAATAADNRTLDLFTDDERYKVLFADENTLKEGFNLQVAGRLIRAQTVWTRGEYEQALSRVERPDEVQKDGSLKYNRKNIFLDWVICTKSLEVAKTVRLFMKIIEAAKFDNYGLSRHFNDWIEGKPVRGVAYTSNSVPGGVPALLEKTAGPITFSPSFVEFYSEFEKLAYHEELFQLYTKWMYSEYDATKEDLRAAIAKELGVPVAQITDNRLRQAALKPLQHENIPNTVYGDFGNGYMPFLPGVKPYDPWDLGIIEASRLVETEQYAGDDEDIDVDEEDSIEQIRLEKGMIVFTEYGLCEVDGLGKSSVRVNISGRDVRVPKTGVWVPAQPKDRDRLYRIYMQMQKKKLPTTTLEIAKGKLLVNNIFVDEKQLTGFSPGIRKPQVSSINITAVPEETSAGKDIPATQKPLTPIAAGPGRSRLKVPTVGLQPERPTVAPPKIKIPSFKKSTRTSSQDEEPIVPAKTPIKIPTFRKQTAVNPGTKPNVPTKEVAPKVPTAKKAPKIAVELHIGHLNNALTLIAMTEDSPEALIDHGFHRIGAAVSCHIKTWRGLDNLLTYLDNRFSIDKKSLDVLEDNLKLFRSSEGKLEKIINKVAAQREFMLTQTRPAPASKQTDIFPYLVVYDNTLHLIICGAVSRASRQAAMQLSGHTVVSGVGKFEREEPFFIRFCRSKQDLEENLDMLDPHIRIKNFEDLKDEFIATLENTKVHRR